LASQSNRSKSIWILIPVIGSIIFIALYIAAAILYPGGSQADNTTIGYSWTDNYWCNLLNDNAMNGQTNTAKPVAVAAMLILCISLSSFWILFPASVQLKKYHRLMIQIAGTVSMITAFLLLTNIDHDLAINVSSSSGLIAVLGTLTALYQLKWKTFFVFGLLNLLLIGLNNYIYHISGDLTYLPIVQKISFLSFLIWICCIEMKLYRRIPKVINS
jgi:hypothetical protein